MKATRHITTLLAAGTVLAAGIGMAAPASATATNRCLQQAPISARTAIHLTDKPATVNLAIRGETCDNAAFTVQKSDGTHRQKVALPDIEIHPDFTGTYGTFQVPLSIGASTWQVTHVHSGTSTHQLPTPLAFTVQRGTKVTAAQTSAPYLPGQSVTVAGTGLQYTASGSLVALGGKTVSILNGGTVLGTSRTDAAGRYAVTFKPSAGISSVNVRILSGNPQVVNGTWSANLKAAPRPTTLTGTAGPTAGGVVRPGTKMSTFGHLKVMYTNGQTGPYAGQEIHVQTRPRSNPAAPYTTVVKAKTSTSGYYYANWNAAVDVDVRVAYLSPYTGVKSAYRWLTVIDVQ
ncbi:hypothetical protein [Kribbella deserti]|uniref:Bacterial Ig domain-containing protein n=1 Tax=Kribbella deserti TaxID=1926257 RepID=A0ABV6QGI1_9ACTN